MEIQENLYCVFDKLSGTFHHFTTATSDGLAVRNILLTLTCPLKDNVCLKLGRFDKIFAADTQEISLSDCSFLPCGDFQIVDWSVYKFPNDVAEALAPLGCSPDEIKEITRQKISESSSSGVRVPNGALTETFKNLNKGE